MDQLIRDSRSFMRWYGRNIPIILLVLFSVDCLFLHFKQAYSLIVYLPVFAVVIGMGYKKKNRIEQELEAVCADFDRRLSRSEEGSSVESRCEGRNHSVHEESGSSLANQGESGSTFAEDHDSASSLQSSSDPASAAPDNHDPAISPLAEAKKHLDELVKQTRHFCKAFGQSIPGVLLGLLGAASLIGHLDGAYIAGAFSITFIMSFFLSRNLTRIQNQVLQDFSYLES